MVLEQCKEAAEAWLPADGLTLLLFLIGILAWVPWAINRWRYRHIPGPFAPPVLGNLLGLAQHDLHGYINICKQRYGNIFKIYIGSNMIICIADPAIARRVFSKVMHRHTGVQLTAGDGDWDLLIDGLVGANGDEWRKLRTAWTPAFSQTSLDSYAAVMNKGAAALVTRLAAAAGSGEEVELFGELAAMTLEVVGSAAYGVNLQAMARQQQQQQQDDLLSSVQVIFEGAGVTNSSHYLPLVLLFPWLAKTVQWAAYHWPDKKLAKLSKARKRIRQLNLQLIRKWRSSLSQQQQQQQQDEQDQLSANSTAAAAAAAAAVCGANGGSESPSSGPGVFQELMLNAVDKETGQKLSDEQVVSQFNTFLITSFESTAAGALYCIYHIAQHDQVQRRLLQEIDDVTINMRQNNNHNITQQDLPKFPYLAAVMKEALRLSPPSAIATRFTHEPIQLTKQVTLPVGVPLFGCIEAMHKDDEYWPAATEFKPERWLPEGARLQPSTPDAYAPFGFGARLCVGKKFAEQEIATVLIRLYQQYTFELLHPEQQIPLPLKHTLGLIPAAGLRVRVHKRS